MFDTKFEKSVFSELFGFALVDPLALDEFHGESMIGRDLLSLYTTTDAGDEVCKSGAVVPVFGVEAGYYSVVIRDAASETVMKSPPSVSSAGWVLHVMSAEVVICGLGYLANWNPDHRSMRRVRLPQGWYSASVAVGEPNDVNDDFMLEIMLQLHAQQPAFTADLSALMRAS